MIIRVLILSLLVWGCAPSPSDKNRGDLDGFKIFSERTLTQSSNELTGSGRIQFTQPLLGTNSKEHYLISFRTLSNENSRLILHSHFSGFQLDDGVRIELSVVDHVLNLRISTPSYPFTKPVPLFEVFSEEEISLRLDVHDETSSGVRVIVWRDQLSLKDEVKLPQSRIHIGNHLFDSLEQQMTFFSHGRGLFWGLEMDQIVLLKAQRHRAYVD